jgi:hypothetical protein
VIETILLLFSFATYLFLRSKLKSYPGKGTNNKLEEIRITALQEPFSIGAIFRAAPLTTSRKSLFNPTCFAYFCRWKKRDVSRQLMENTEAGRKQYAEIRK